MGVRKALSTLGLLALPPAGLAYLFESTVRRNLFRTGPHVEGVPEAIGVPFERTRFWSTDGQELEGWLFHGGDLSPTILFMHGTNYNASDMWATPERALLFGQFLRGIGCRFFVFDYRGYGPNSGEATEQGTYLDAAGALAWLHNQPAIDATQIIFYGFSMGTGVAVQLSLHEPSAGLILRAPFTSIRDLVLHRSPRLRLPLALAPWLPLSRFNSAAKIRHISVPLLIMHGDADSSVPYLMGQRLYELAPEPKTFVTLPGAEHQDLPLDVMTPAVRAFVERVTAIPATA